MNSKRDERLRRIARACEVASTSCRCGVVARLPLELRVDIAWLLRELRTVERAVNEANERRGKR